MTESRITPSTHSTLRVGSIKLLTTACLEHSLASWDFIRPVKDLKRTTRIMASGVVMRRVIFIITSTPTTSSRRLFTLGHSTSRAVKFGLRYAEDNKDVLERRGYYFENMFPFLYVGSFIKSDAMYAAYGLVDAATAQANGITDLAWVNILMGNTTNFVQSPLAYDPDPTNPISPTCAYLRYADDVGGVSLASPMIDWTPNDQTLVITDRLFYIERRHQPRLHYDLEDELYTSLTTRCKFCSTLSGGRYLISAIQSDR